MNKCWKGTVFVMANDRFVGVGKEGVLGQIIEFMYPKKTDEKYSTCDRDKAKMNKEVDLPGFFKADGRRDVHR